MNDFYNYYKGNENLHKYNEFMHNPDNIGNCSACPESNCGEHCGQQNCWVSVHCQEK